MSRPLSALGDSHNFGRRVAERGGRIHKPRTVFWEWLLLSAESPLRRLLSQIGEDSRAGVRFDFLPSLRVSTPGQQAGLGGGEGEVERITLRPLAIASAQDRQRLAAVTGRAVALYSWLGLGDLHWENLVLGTEPAGAIVFAPLDVELMLDDHALPTQTRLLPESDPDYAALYQHACGVRRVLPFLGKPLAAADLLVMAHAYLTALAVLDGSATAIAETLSTLPELRKAPLRVTLRSTGDYLHPSHVLDPPLLAAEQEQLRRGDIPYFFRLYGRPGIHYFTDAALTQTGRIPSRGDVPQLGRLLPLGSGLQSANRQSLREQGLFCLLAAFDHPSFAGEHAHAGLSVRFAPRRLVVRLPDGDELDTRRDLSTFVSSVYQPCRCGEVESALVPQVTRCRAART